MLRWLEIFRFLFLGGEVGNGHRPFGSVHAYDGGSGAPPPPK
jgi:hypothetical protein